MSREEPIRVLKHPRPLFEQKTEIFDIEKALKYLWCIHNSRQELLNQGFTNQEAADYLEHLRLTVDDFIVYR